MVRSSNLYQRSDVQNLLCHAAKSPRPWDRSLNLREPPDTPDVGLYSPQALLTSGQAGSWNNPDIRLLPNGIVEVFVTNFSSTVPAIDASLRISIGDAYDFGGTWSVLSDVLVTILPRQRLPVRASLQLATHSYPAFIRVRAEVNHPFDENVLNNRGDRAAIRFDLGLTPPQSTLPIWIQNSQNSQQTISLSIISVPPEIQATLPPPTVLLPLERRLLHIALEPASSLATGTALADLTLVARDRAGALIDGLTLSPLNIV